MNSYTTVNNRAAATTPSRPLEAGFHYVWAVGATRETVGTRINDRYQVTAPQVWLDTRPDQDPDSPEILTDTVVPYLHLYPYRLHVPEVYGVCRDEKTGAEILLLENVPLTETGELQPSIVQVWNDASAVRQVYWLWQLLELWNPFCKLEVASSLLSVENTRIEGWRIRLKELIFDNDPAQTSFAHPTLMNLSECWLTLLPGAKPAIAEPMQAICALMQASDADAKSISAHLNQLLLEQSARLPLRLQVFGATDVGRQRSHNEDSCYPLTIGNKSLSFDDLAPRLSIVCDGIGGHEGGEVASQLAVQTLQLQIRALLTEIAEQSEPMPPDLVCEQLAAIVRVVNNVIAAQNDSQDRHARRRMGTTLVMALQIPQRIKLPGGAVASNAHEVYIANVGDSRAYWITPKYCHQLTVDDDVAVREVRMARSIYREALKRLDSGAITQALGTRDGQYLYPAVQRFILEEDGILLLCSDGMSDNGFVERSWQDYAELILEDKFSLEAAVQSWLEFANQQNGHDNATIVLTQCQVSSLLPDLRIPISLPDSTLDNELPEPIVIPPTEVAQPPRKRSWFRAFLLLLISGILGAGTWLYFHPSDVQRIQSEFETLKDRLPKDLLKQ